MPSKRLTRTRALFALVTLLAGCSQILGLSDGTDQGPCETTADCAPGYECREATCTSTCTSADCTSANAGGDDANAGGRDPNPSDGGTPASNGGKAAANGGSTGGKTSTTTAGAAATAGAAGAIVGGTGGRAPIDLPSVSGTGTIPKFP